MKRRLLSTLLGMAVVSLHGCVGPVPKEARQALAPIQSKWRDGKYEEALKQVLLLDGKWEVYLYSIYRRTDFPLAPKITGTTNAPCAYLITVPQDRRRVPEFSFGLFAPAGIEHWSVVAINEQSHETIISSNAKSGAFVAFHPYPVPTDEDAVRKYQSTGTACGPLGGIDIFGSVCASCLKSAGHYILRVHVVEKGGRAAFAQTEIEIKKAAAEPTPGN